MPRPMAGTRGKQHEHGQLAQYPPAPTAPDPTMQIAPERHPRDIGGLVDHEADHAGFAERARNLAALAGGAAAGFAGSVMQRLRAWRAARRARREAVHRNSHDGTVSGICRSACAAPVAAAPLPAEADREGASLAAAAAASRGRGDPRLDLRTDHPRRPLLRALIGGLALFGDDHGRPDGRLAGDSRAVRLRRSETAPMTIRKRADIVLVRARHLRKPRPGPERDQGWPRQR